MEESALAPESVSMTLIYDTTCPLSLSKSSAEDCTFFSDFSVDLVGYE